MKQLLFSFCCIFALAACTAKGFAPSDIDDTQVEFILLQTTEENSKDINQSYICRFTSDNTYQSFKKGGSLHAGNYSYSRKNSHAARLVFSYSENNALKSYEMNLHFNTATTGKWESSFNNTQVGAQSGTFEMKPWEN